MNELKIKLAQEAIDNIKKDERMNIFCPAYVRTYIEGMNKYIDVLRKGSGKYSFEPKNKEHEGMKRVCEYLAKELM